MSNSKPATYESAYNVHPFFGVSGHRVRITIDGDPTTEWSLTFDGNTCQLDAFGDVKLSTMMYFFPWCMTLKLLQHEEHQKLYSVDLHRKGIGPVEAPEVKYDGSVLRLVTVSGHHHGKHPEWMRLLVLDTHDNIINIIDLPKKQ